MKKTLNIDEHYFSTNEVMLSCLNLSSCIAILIYFEKFKCGGAMHFNSIHNNSLNDFYKTFMLLTKHIKVDLIGGSTLFNTRHGDINAKYLVRFFSEKNIPIDKKIIGGNKIRDVEFDTRTGITVISEKCNLLYGNTYNVI